MPIRIPVLFSAGFFYFVFRIYLHDWSIDTDAWGFIYYGHILMSEGVFVAESNKLLVDLVGMIPVFFNNPALLPLITGAIGSATCLALYEIVLGLTGHRGYALSAWGIILLSPVLYLLVLACNSGVYATCFLMVSLYFFIRKDIHKGSTFLVLAALSRPEPFILIVFVAAFVFWQWRRKEIPLTGLLSTLSKLAIPPVLWMTANFYKTGNAFYSFQAAQSYTKSTGQSYSAADFPQHLFELLSTFYFSGLALALGAAGFLVLMKRFRSLLFLYGYMILTLLGYWVLAPFNIPLAERYLLPTSIYLVIFAALLCKELGDRWAPPDPSNKKFSMASLLPVLFLPLFIHLPAQSIVDRIIIFHKDMDQDIPIVANHLRRQFSDKGAKELKVLASARRTAHLNYLLYEYRSRLSITALRTIYFNETDFLKEQVDWVVYAPNDLYPLKSAFYLFDLLSEEGLKKQGIHLEETLHISENTQLLHLTR